jgi:hypothetical protein
MKTRHNKMKKYKNRKNITRKRSPGHRGKQWITAIEKATDTYKKTNSFNKARLAFRKQALFNARKLFGSI